MCRALVATGCTVRGYDFRETPVAGVQSHVAGLLDDTALSLAVGGARAVIHLAATPDDSPYPPEVLNNFEVDLVPNNIVGTYRVLEACRRVGVSKVLLASTVQVIDGQLTARNTPVTLGAAYRPRYLYACTKVMAEQLGRVYAEQHNLRVLVVRFGWCPRDPAQVAEIAADAEAQDLYLSPGDVGRYAVAFARCDTLPAFSTLYCVSKPLQHTTYDMAPTRKLLGFVPQDSWPTGCSSEE